MALPFFCAANLVDPTLAPGVPWEFLKDEKDNWLKKMSKPQRRKALLDVRTRWNVYSAIRGQVATLRVSTDNPAREVNALVCDYDMPIDIAQACANVNGVAPGRRPSWLEVSLSGKARLIWLFECPVLVPSNEFCQEFLKDLVNDLKAPILLAGYDAASVKPAEVWSNGGVWLSLDDPEVPPAMLSKAYLFGVACAAGKKTSLFANSEISLDVIASEVEKRWPGRWQGEFKLDATGIRFWDETADNEQGCQVKPDGMLCFTGKEPFQKWESLFGREWCQEKRILKLGEAGKDLMFDGKNYWEPSTVAEKKYEPIIRCDAVLHLQHKGLSTKMLKGATMSDADRVLRHVQTANRIIGAAPLVNYPPGLVTIEGNRVLNIADLHPTVPVKGATGTEADFPWLWDFMRGLFPGEDFMPLHHFLAWLQRSYRAVLNYRPYMGQAIFLCGPKNNGKTLVCLHLVKPLLGNRVANPNAYLQGDTDFNSELFSAFLLAINDDNSSTNEAARRRMITKLKGLVVNPIHKFHAKFEKPLTVFWTGRIFVTLNDDSGSVSMLPEVEVNSHDKMMFFASQPHDGAFPPQDVLEATIARELPAFAWWLLNIYVPPAEVLSDDRMGVRSYFDPKIRDLAHEQTFSSNLQELIEQWKTVDAYWQEPGNETWSGTPTALLSALQTCAETHDIAGEWTQQKTMNSLSSLARLDDSGVEETEGEGRDFIIHRTILVDKAQTVE